MPGAMTLDDTAIAALAGNPAVKAEFPMFLAPGRSTTGGCCPAGAARRQGGRMIRAAVLSMPKDRLNRLKQLAGVDAFVVPMESGGGLQNYTV